MVADRKDGVEVEVLDLVGLAIRRSCCFFCNNCLPLQFLRLEHVPQVPRDHRLVAPEQLGHLVERQPDRLPFQPHLEPDLAVRSLVDRDLATTALI
jgi:hypothetical protein